MATVVSLILFAAAWFLYVFLRKTSVFWLPLVGALLGVIGFAWFFPSTQHLFRSEVHVDSVTLPLAGLSQKVKLAFGADVGIAVVGADGVTSCPDKAASHSITVAPNTPVFALVPPGVCDFLHLAVEGNVLKLSLEGSDRRCLADLTLSAQKVGIERCEGGTEDHVGTLAIQPKSEWKFSLPADQDQSLTPAILGLSQVQLGPVTDADLLVSGGSLKLQRGGTQYLVGRLNLLDLKVAGPSGIVPSTSLTAELEGTFEHVGSQPTRSLIESLEDASNQVKAVLLSLLTGLILILDFRKRLREELAAASAAAASTTPSAPPVPAAPTPTLPPVAPVDKPAPPKEGRRRGT